MQNKKQYKIKGMTCSACASKVEKAVSQTDGADVVSVNLLTNSLTVYGDVSSESVIKAVRQAGYEAAISDGSLIAASKKA